MNKITQMLMEIVSELSGKPAGAYNIREDGQCAGRQSTIISALRRKQANQVSISGYCQEQWGNLSIFRLVSHMPV